MDLGAVDLTDEDEARIEGLARREHLDRVEAEAIVRFAKVDRSERDPNDLAEFVAPGGEDAADVFDGLTESECAEIRRRMAEARRPSAVVDRYPTKHTSVIFRHAQGRCGHDIDTSPTTSPRVGKVECRDFREAFQDGKTIEDLRAEFHRSTNAVTKHVFGRCDHSFEDAQSYTRFDAAACAAIRRAYRRNTTATVGDIARAWLVASGTAHRHLRGDCTHGVDEDPVAASFEGFVEPEECRDMRRAYHSGLSCRDLAADVFDRDYQIIRKHVFGRCGHGDVGSSPADNDSATVTKSDCAAMRRAYKLEGDTPVSDLLNRFDVGKGTLYYHVYGRCVHDSKREDPAKPRNKP